MTFAERFPRALLVVTAFAVSACDAPLLLATRGEPGNTEARLGWLFTIVVLVVMTIVTVLLLVALFRRREPADPHAITREGGGVRWILIGGIAMPAMVLMALFVLVLTTLSATARPVDERIAARFDIIAHRWWWEIRQVDNVGRTLFTTANELHIPVGEAVLIRLSSADVIHSFWIPQLAGKTDAVPGQVNTAWLQADSTGAYFGHCAEYCGLQHAHMAMRVIAEEQPAFQAWLDHERQDALMPRTPAELAGRDVFMRSACAGCHRIRGTDAAAIVGPDLTHVGARRTLAAGALPNTPGNLAGWIANSQTIKPGNDMPVMYLTSEDLQALVMYLSGLR